MLPLAAIGRITRTTLVYTCSYFASDLSAREKHLEEEERGVSPGVGRTPRSKGEEGSQTSSCA